jgi:hypothetical protein
MKKTVSSVKIDPKRIVIRHETIALLTPLQLEKVAGGRGCTSGDPACPNG